jgi:hypothetical protein
MGSSLLTLLLLGFLVWFWFDSMRSRERLLFICKQTCKNMQLTLLDETVVVSRLRPGRNARGTLQLRRWYEFEVCADGLNRHPGYATLLGGKVEYLSLDLPDGPVITHTTGIQGQH